MLTGGGYEALRVAVTVPYIKIGTSLLNELLDYEHPSRRGWENVETYRWGKPNSSDGRWMPGNTGEEI